LLKLTLAAALLLAAPTARAQVESMEMRAAFFDQTGHGYQSVDGPPSGPGSEDALIFEPLFQLRFKQDESWSHTVTLAVDIVSNASIDAIDAVSTASAVNEAASLDVTSSHKDDLGRLDLRYGVHFEEPMRSFFLGGGYAWSLADDNFTLALSGLATFDFFDDVTRFGRQDGLVDRQSLNGNLALSQVLSPTTLLDASYGVTLQTGVLQTTYNSVPLDGGGRGDEIFPSGRRVRHALAARLAQHVPWTATTLKASYRYYRDDYHLEAHTAEGMLYQYLCDWLYLRASYRYHWQSGVDFFATHFATTVAPGPETSDSDLAPLRAHELGLKAVLLAERSPWAGLHDSFIEASVYHYFRSNDLRVTWLTLAFGRRF
jgi:hypothetical protein